ncbi:hypothetical protein [Bdellovibrio svalbardensis]|uniref:Restriction endonuclease type IV Mrr domain-containing protein n=1 Tax=Bdellovibrio svalbardensis TaxID=2972972 RepID=A0ABT6DHN9_9BACT|nr:hypothetical protein [Bdellovibrio svalbardensis]MDG0816024.1 hypothetical protein [Bdellovibrio svalbardensis]
MKHFILVCSLFFSLNTFAATWAEDFENLKSVPRSYEDSGAICEEIARLDVQKSYPAPQYEVITGISYSDEQRRVIGELDVIVFDKNMNKVIRIAEVKCWKDIRAGLEKAMEQRQRFLKAIRSSKGLIFRSTSSDVTYSKEQFEGVSDFITLGQKGTVQAGYGQELEYTLLELHQHRYDMIACQHKGLCVKP